MPLIDCLKIYLFNFYILLIIIFAQHTSMEASKLKNGTENNQPPASSELHAKQEVQPLLTIIHFNDVYDLQPKGGSMGVCYFKAKIDALRKENPKAITLFSGDCFSPSTLTNIKGGQQMVYALNQIGIDCACFGNHEFDFDIEHTLKLAKACNWPWLLGNIRFTVNGTLLGQGQPYIIKQHNGLKIGILGVAGQDWIGILSDQYENVLEYEDCYQFAKRTATFLKEKVKCDMVIALTHMRNNPDRDFPNRVPNVDLVLGGHDHVIMEQFVNGVPVIKSGTNFNNVGLIKIYPKTYQAAHQGARFNYDWKIFKVTITQKVDQSLQKYVDDLMHEYSKFDEVVGYTDTPLQTRFIKIRTEETNLGNFFTDLCRLYYDTDIALINAGMIRNDVVLPVGRLTYSKISNIIDSPMVAKKILGKNILKALEYSVDEYPGFAGKFLFVSGLRFEFDHTKKPRVQRVWIGDQSLDLQRQYTMTTTFYQSKGGDGFEMMKGGEVFIDQVKGTTMLNLLLKFFKAPDTHQQYESIKMLQSKQSNNSNSSEELDLVTFPLQHLVLVKKVSVRMGRIKDLRSRFVLNTDGSKLTSIAPIVDDRIICLTKDKVDSVQ